jgi:hypothetical protein
MKKVFQAFAFSLPIQLLLLHCRRYQIFLVCWYVLFSTIAGHFMKNYGADTLFLAPEYFNQVSAASTAITGFAVGIFFMSWNITTFILHGHLVSFLATNSQPFLKYCINNIILPLVFLVFYFFKAYKFATQQELFTAIEMLLLALSFFGGLCVSIFLAFAYFFGADKTIYYTIGNKIKSANEQYNQTIITKPFQQHRADLKVNWFFSARFQIRTPRDVRHYDDAFLKKILSRHHFAAVVAIMIAFVFLVAIGFISDDKLFQLPAAASIIIFFSILIAVAGAFTIFFRSWTLLCLLILYLFVNFLYQKEIIDPRNKAYGLNYENKTERPAYNRASIAKLASYQNIENDKAYYLKILNNWKAKQKDSLPIMYIINTSGGGLRSATFTINVLQRLDSLMKGNLMNQTLFITGASGGMLGATYYRELFLKQKTSKINIQSKAYVDNISTDLLNPLFSSFVSRDLIGPVQKFNYNNYKYTKDRGYAFEEKLNENTQGLLDKTIKDYLLPEQKAEIPFMLFSSVISRDARKMLIATHPARFLMKPNCNNDYIHTADADAIDFTSFFEKQNAGDLRLLSALRMNATFPYALPNVWLPSTPVIDVMDAGLRDNYGAETTLRLLSVFEDWIKVNTSKVVVLQIRDRSLSDWDKPTQDDDYLSFLTKPLAQLQHNWFKLQDYYQAGQTNYASNMFEKKLNTICWQYLPTKANEAAGLSFHLTSAEKNDIAAAVDNEINNKSFKKFNMLLR